jgi:AraC family transcriptional regulator
MTINPILHAKSNRYYWKGEGLLSIKTFSNGRAYYNTGRGHYMVEEGKYLLLNRGQEYSISIESESPVESFCVFFPDGMVEKVYKSLVTSQIKLLDFPYDQPIQSLEFVEKTYQNDDLLLPALLQLRIEYINQIDSMWLEEKLHEIIQKLLLVHRQVYFEMMKLPSLRFSTKEELYRRVHIGHEYLTAYFNTPISLTEISKVACLSPNHFLRNYKLMFGVSPHQYLIERRLQEAKRLLLISDKSVTDICFEVGFQSHGSFSYLFSKRFGLSPSKLRKSDFREVRNQ